VVNSYPSSNNAMEISRIHLEGFFGIFINEISPTKTLNEYITETEKIYNMNNSSENSSFHSFKELYTFTPLSESNADDAVIVKKNASSGYGDNVPFSSTMALYKKGGRIYSLSTGQQLINCYAPLKGVKWDIPRSFKLL